MRIPAKDIARFENKIEKQENGCWLWLGKLSSGYGRIAFKGVVRGSHRFFYILYKGEIPEGMYVCHACDVRNCVNPDHLWLGTAKDNAQDMAKKGRQSCGIGTKGRKVKHTEETKLKMSKTRTGMKHAKETKLKIGLAHKGMKHSYETKNFISSINKGNKNRLGKKHSEETKLKMSLTKTGKIITKEAKMNMKNSQLGRKHSVETKLKMSESQKIRFNKIKMEGGL